MDQVKALPDPRFTYRYYIEEVETRVGAQRQAFELAQRFPWFGKLKLRGDAAFEASEEGLPAVADDPLGYAIGAFVACVKTGEDVFVTGGDARRALDTALGIIEATKVSSH